MSVTSNRWLPLDGAANARDLGGLPLADGSGRIRAGVVVRSDNLQGLTPGDVEHLVEQLGVRVVVDLRTGAEVDAEGPGPLAGEPRVEIRHRSLYPEAGVRTDVVAAEEETVLPWQRELPDGDPEDSWAVRSYLGYLRDRPDSIVAALADVAEAPGATVVHCAAGKDRTGIVCALALEVAGVAREAIVADYVATGDRLEPLLARLGASPTYAADIHGSTADAHRPRAETMTRFFARLQERYGGAIAWLDAHGFGADAREALRARLVTAS